MAGKSKFADRMASHVGEPIDAACPITHSGGTAGRIGGAVGGAVGAGLASGGGSGPSDIEVPQFAWLGLGPERFTLTKASAMGKPTGDPLAQIAYTEVTATVLTPGKASLKADLDLADGRHLAFEVQSRGTGKPSIGVLELLAERCTLA